MPASPRPSSTELAAAQDATLPDLIRPGLRCLFVGINPGLWSAASGHHFGNPANRLWPTLHAAGFTPRRFLPADGDELLALGLGITNLVSRATATAAEISPAELRAGVPALTHLIERYRPAVVAFLAMTAYRVAFDRPKAVPGERNERLAGARVWLLPNPSGLNASYQLPDLVRLYGQLHAALDAVEPPGDA
ncbi:MAG: G/U mismatch-specific DNA glycosylase [Actinomycetota bacterium]|nr:G/U mismatch-specific DNA glycosylase [Actinomycetota bacterium]